MSFFTSFEETILKNADSKSVHNLSIELALGDDLHKNEFEAFCNEIKRVIPQTTIIRKHLDSNDQPKPTELRLKPNLRYRLLPTAKMLEPFLNAAFNPKSMQQQFSGAINDLVKRISLPAKFKLYITPHCAVCPIAVRWMVGLAIANPSIILTIIDGAMYPEAIAQDQVQSAPTLILDNHYRWIGSLDLHEILTLASNRKPTELSANYFQGIIEDGGAQDVARMMIQDDVIYPNFIELLVHPKWPVRLGAMVALEYLAEDHNDLAMQVIKPLEQHFHAAENPIKGDILYIMGEIGGEEAIRIIKEVLDGTYAEEVTQAAQEALEKIEANRI